MYVELRPANDEYGERKRLRSAIEAAADTAEAEHEVPPPPLMPRVPATLPPRPNAEAVLKQECNGTTDERAPMVMVGGLF